MELMLIDEQGKPGSTMTVSDAAFGRDYNEALVHQVVTAFLANARSGDRAQKTRSEVAATTHKPWRQKGTGRARAGRSSSPLWRGGGVTFPNKPNENFTHKVNRKMYRAGLATVLSQLAREGKLKVVESLNVESPKTRLLAGKLKAMGFSKVLIVADSVDDNLWLSSRNLRDVYVIEPHQADPWSLLKFGSVLMTRGAVKQFEEMV